MQADFSVELEQNDPVLELPWAAEDGSCRYYDLKRHPELVLQIPEAASNPELSAFLTRINTPGFPLLTAKCDAWTSTEIFPEEEIFGADRKFVSYVDLVFTGADERASFEHHEKFAEEICRLLQRAPDIAAAAEFIVRRCIYQDESAQCDDRSGSVPGKSSQNASRSGFYFTVYITGFGDAEQEPRKPWAIAMTLVQHALVQLAGRIDAQ